MKKLISLFLVVSVLLLSGNMFAQERKGAEGIIQRTDGTQVRSELIAVKENSLLLMERESGADVTVDIEAVKIIRIVKKSKLLMGAGIGILAGGTVWAIRSGAEDYGSFGAMDTDMIIACVVYGLVALGAIGGVIAGKDKTIQMDGKSELVINAYLKELRKKARVKNAR